MPEHLTDLILIQSEHRKWLKCTCVSYGKMGNRGDRDIRECNVVVLGACNGVHIDMDKIILADRHGRVTIIQLMLC